MQLRDVFEGYSKCVFCGKVLGRTAYVPPGGNPKQLYCSQKCHEFSGRYRELKQRLGVGG